jgi:hypothetical protein
VTKGMHAYYLSRIPLNEAGSSYLISPVEVKLLELDQRDGESPFYTLGSSVDGKEIQTERYRYYTSLNNHLASLSV